MNNHSNNNKAKIGLIQLFAGACCWFATHTADAASFQIFSGYSFANPAWLGFVDDYQAAVGLDTVFQDAEFKGSAEFLVPGFGVVPIGADTSVSDDPLYLPTGRIAKRLSSDWVVGIDVTSPFFCDQNWGMNSFLRYIGTKTELKTINIAPNVVYEFSDKLFIGAGFDAQYLEAELNFALPQGLIPFPGTPSAEFTNAGSDWGYGWHAGLVYHAFEGTFLSFAYYSQVQHNISGVSSFLYASPTTSDFTVSSKLPSTFWFDVVQYFSPEWLVRASVSRTNWSSIQELRLKNTAIAPQVAMLSPSTNPDGDVVIGLSYNDSWRYGLGTRYDFNKTWSGLASFTYDTTPTNREDFSARAPDGDIFTLAGGFTYHFNDTQSVDLIYAHSFIQDQPLDHIDGFVRAVGTASMNDDTISILFTMKG